MSRPRPDQPKLEPYRDLVGTASDEEIAALAGCSVDDVAAYRALINLPAPKKASRHNKLLITPASSPVPSGAVVVETIPLDAIAKGGVQVRASMNAATVEAYAAAMAEGADFPPVSVVRIGDDPALVLVDGFHRAAAARKIGRTSILAEVRQVATKGEAIATASAANARHGLPLSNQDKRNAVITALRDADLCQLTGRQLAAQLGVSHELVNKIRRELGLDAGACLDESRPWSLLAMRAATDHERDSIWQIAAMAEAELPARVFLPILAEAVKLRRAELGLPADAPPVVPFRPDAPPKIDAPARPMWTPLDAEGISGLPGVPAEDIRAYRELKERQGTTESSPPPEEPWSPPTWSGDDPAPDDEPTLQEREEARAVFQASLLRAASKGAATPSTGRRPQSATIAAAVEFLVQALKDEADLGGADVTLARALDVRLRQGCARDAAPSASTEPALSTTSAIYDTLAAEVPKAILSKHKAKLAPQGTAWPAIVEAAHAVVVEKWTKDPGTRAPCWAALDHFYGWSEAELFAAMEDADLRRWLAYKVDASARDTDGAIVARVMLRRRPLGAARP